MFTATEKLILGMLERAEGTTVTRDQINAEVYGDGKEGNSNVIEVLVSRIRKKMPERKILTVRGIGYQLERDHGQA